MVRVFLQVQIALIFAISSEAVFIKDFPLTRLLQRESLHTWPCKNGNAFRSGVSRYSGPRNITSPIWEWTIPDQIVIPGVLHNGHVESAPLIDKDHNIYIATTIGEVFALARNGSQLWKHLDPGARMFTGAIEGNSLYVANSAGLVLSLDLKSGKENWRTQYSPMAGGDSPGAAVVSGAVIIAGASTELTDVGGNDEVVALSAADGTVMWRFKPESFMYNFMPAALGDRLLFIDRTGAMYCLSISTGALQWKAEGSQNGFTTAGLSIGPNGVAYTTFNTNGADGGVLKAYNSTTGAPYWTRNLGLEAAAAPVVGKLSPTGPVAVLTGIGKNQGKWKESMRDGKAVLRAFDAETGADLWTFQSPSMMIHGSSGPGAAPIEDSVPDTWSTPSIGADGTIYVGWQGGKHFAIDGATGTMISSFYTGFGTQGGPAIGDGLLVIASTGKVAAFSSL
eukprot:TRINITY_DN73407_c0_g1_i1.p1 TRINITY_DN73407_c0_g1~~TRINITY_DN73407_c0_g1_i1.p1  ORF type:complete len:470 (+),score=57.86 TRINITY_DN73407_c0_g1_i1:59-1411(+)